MTRPSLAAPALAALMAVATISATATAQPRDPLEVARVLAARYPTTTEAIGYIPALTWMGALRLAGLTGERGIAARTVAQIRPFVDGERAAIVEPYRLTNLAGLAALSDVSDEVGEPALDLARTAADLMVPADPDAVVAHATGWTDDMYMAASLLGRAGARTGDPRYAATASRTLLEYADRLQRPDGLFVHSADGPFAWGRGNGFAALGLAEALEVLGDALPDRDRILEVYRRQMAALKALQAEDGSWHQVVDVPASYPELTVTAMTLSAMARGVRLGWLPRDEYLPAIERAWSAVDSRIAPDGSVRDACASTAAGTTLQYYLDRPAVEGFDDRAAGLALMAAVEMARVGG